MKDSIKALLRKSLNHLHIDLTKNLEYDRLTSKIISKTVSPGSSCIDIGAHKGEILDLFLKYAPNGKHFAFEPIPMLYENLKRKYSATCGIYPIALSDSRGKTTFQFVKNAPAYSGIKKRKYDIKDPEIEEIEVQLDTLDSVLDGKHKIDFIKIDVEGAELAVLKGSKDTIRAHRPYVLFECGLGASDYYGTKAEDVFDFFTDASLHISVLKDWLQDEKRILSKEQFCEHFAHNTEYYFLAHI